MDPLEQVIRLIHAELERRCAGTIGLGVCHADKVQHKGGYMVLWVEQGGAPEKPKATIRETLCADVSRVHITIWAESDEYCRLLYFNLLQAAEVIWGDDFQLTGRNPPDEAQQMGWATRGKVIEAEAKISIRVSSKPYRLPYGETPPADTVPRVVTGHTISTGIDQDGES